MRFFILFLMILLCVSCRTVSIQGEKVKTSVICGDCNPGSFGRYMVLDKQTYQPEVETNSTPKTIAHGLLGYVFPENNMSANQSAPCSTQSAVSPFTIDQIKPLSSVGGQDVFYNVKEVLTLNVSAAVNTDIDEIRALQPTVADATLQELRASLTSAYSKFANKELSINGKYYQYQLERNEVVALAKGFKYTDCKADIYGENPKRMITAVGLVYFNITSDNNSVDELSAALDAEAKAKGVTVNIAANFKRKISTNLKKVTKDYYQIVAWRTVGIPELDSYR